MKLVFLKVDTIVVSDKNNVIYIPAGGIQFEFRNKTISLKDPLQIEMTHEGKFNNVVRYIDFVVYEDQSLNTTGEIKREGLFSIVAHEEVRIAIHKELKKRCKIVPFKPLNVQELFSLEFENAYKQLVGV